MSAAMYDSAVEDFARGELDWERDTIKVVLVGDEYVPSQSQDATRADLRRFEVPSTGSYRAGGETLFGTDVVRSELGGEIRLTAGSVEWTGVSAEFRYAVVYQANGSPENDRLVAYTDFGRVQTVDNARVLLEYDGGVADFNNPAAT